MAVFFKRELRKIRWLCRRCESSWEDAYEDKKPQPGDEKPIVSYCQKCLDQFGANNQAPRD